MGWSPAIDAGPPLRPIGPSPSLPPPRPDICTASRPWQMTVNDGLVKFHGKTIRPALVHYCHGGQQTGQQEDNSARTASTTPRVG